MSLHANSSSKGEFELVPAGLYTAHCYRILDQGTQTITNSFGTKHQHKVMFSWELLDDEVKMEDGRPFAVHKTYTLSLNEKANLRADIESWQNRELEDAELEDFDLSTLIDSYCQIQVVHSDDGKFANVQSIVSYKPVKNEKGEKVFPKGVNDLVVFDIDEPDMAVFDALSDNMKDKIMKTPEWQKVQQARSATRPKQEKEEGEKVKEALDNGDTEALPQDFKDAFGFDGKDGIPDITKEDIELSAETAKKAAGKVE